VGILHEALAEPVKAIASNSGADSGWVLHKVEDAAAPDHGFNAMTMKFESMYTAGIVDPAKVTRSAVENALSIGVMILTTEALISDIPEKKPDMPGGGMPGGMGGMDGMY
jgi:chaperonin GroEL